ncbi:DMT family transporter [Seonamhaeicola marinus]|uniref:EamA family transporter n=1 Tax=Seonamhaeicola marinus TaxID=1912246 RepID=A0A5D0HF75_9FLAO|nr:DMT family transporter [Seonamhaeicola marinus]TYA69946.1 EamA family transporter [Seonamhaeicola marinus]
MKSTHFKNVLELSFATFLISTAAVLGKYIQMPAAVIIWWRAFIALIVLYVFCRYKKIAFKFDSYTDRAVIIISAIFLGAHWVTYFYSVKISNVSIGMLSLYTFPAITSILEPIFTDTKFDKAHLPLGLMVLVGIYILAPEFNIQNSDFQGILWGLFSAILFTLRNIILKKRAQKYNGTMLMTFQLIVVTITLSPVLYFMSSSGIENQYPYIILLALFATAIGHSLFLKSLKHFSASTASIILSTQPIFGIILAFFFLNEIPSSNTYIGGALILATVIVESIRSRQK